MEGDEATGRWYLEDKVLMPQLDLVLEGAAFITDRYVRVDGGWLIAHTGYARIYEVTWAIGDLPSYELKIGTADHPD